jgi:hypothetical protein
LIATTDSTKLKNAAQANREAATLRSRAAYSEVSDIGEVPAVVNPERKESCRLNLCLFLQTYFPNSTGLSPFSPDHERMIERLQSAILFGGRTLNAVYRGFAKTSISIGAALWAVIYGHRRYVAVFSANEPQAKDLIASIKMELSENDLLMEDFPEVCHAFWQLEGKAQRCHSQTCQGELTHIVFRADRVAMPFIAGSLASGAILASRGMTGSGTRGLLHTMPDGTKQRPDFTIIDDPQTAETASTPAQVKKRLDIIKRDIMKLAGHNKPMSCVVNATVIAADDLVEQLLDPKRNPSWQGERVKMVRQWSEAHDTLWMGTKEGFEGQCYANIRNTWDRSNPADQQRAFAEATAFYEANRAAMDAGCVISWESCFAEGELSAIQHAYNFLIDDGPDIFATECQNEPPKQAGEEGRLTAVEICSRLNNFARFEFPREVEHVTAFIDVQGSLLYYVVAAWAQDFTGYVIDYGSFPDQRRRYYTLNDATRTLEVDFPRQPIESQWFMGLEKLTDSLASREWVRKDGTTLRLGKCIVDANYGESTKTVKRFCLTSKYSSILQASHGKGIRASDSPMGMWPVQQGEKRGHNWLLRPDKEARGLRHLLIDTNYWKSFVHKRLRMLPSSRGSLSLWGNEPRTHEMFADHLTAEYYQHTEGRNRELDEWSPKPGKPDNHWFDCIVGCAVGASMLGAVVSSDVAPIVRKRISLQEMAKRARGN